MILDPIAPHVTTSFQPPRSNNLPLLPPSGVGETSRRINNSDTSLLQPSEFIQAIVKCYAVTHKNVEKSHYKAMRCQLYKTPKSNANYKLHIKQWYNMFF